jgi:hypothetical protein
MKGIELPINILIIVAVAVIVLIALIAMFYPAFSSGSQTVNVESVKNAACQVLVTAKNCMAATTTINTPDFDADQDGLIVGDSGQDWGWAVNDPCPPAPFPPGSGCTVASTGDNTCHETTATGNEDDNLAALCKCYYGITSEAQCKALCGC